MVLTQLKLTTLLVLSFANRLLSFFWLVLNHESVLHTLSSSIRSTADSNLSTSLGLI